MATCCRRYSDISLEAFLLTAVRISGYNSEWFVKVLAAACQFLSHICLSKNFVVSSRGILTRTFHKQLWLGGRLGEDYLYSDTGQDYRYFPSQMFEASLAQIPKFSEKTFGCLFLSQEITLELILWIWCFQQTVLYWSCLCRSWLANFTLYRFLDKWILWSKILNLASTRITNTTWIILSF